MALKHFSIAFSVLVTASLVSSKSFTIVIDTTDSMQDEIDVIQSNIPAVANLLGNVTEFENFIVIPFNDDDIVSPLVTTKPEKLIEALNSLRVRGGTDCPEDSLSGIQKALITSQSESYIFVFTDAYAKYSDKLRDIENLCKDTQSRVVIFLSGSCTPTDSNSVVGYVDVYYDIAKACSGAVFRIAAVNLRKAFRYIKDMIKTDYNDVVNHDAFSGFKQFSFTADSSTTDVLVALSGEYPILQIADSDGNNPNMDKLVDTRQSLVVRVSNLKAGEYRASARCHGTTYLTFYKKNRLPFQYGFSTRLPNSLKETSLRPMPGSSNYVLITLENVDNVRINSVELEFIESNAKKSVILEENANNKRFFTASIFIEPGKAFRMKIVGKDVATYDDIYGSTKIIVPHQLYQDVQWSSPTSEIIQPDTNLIDYGTNATIVCKVNGYPKPTIWWEDDDETTLVSEDILLETPSTYLSFVNIEDMTSNFTLYCKSKNAKGNDVSSIELFVNRTFTFEVLQAPSDQSIDYGNTGKLYCEVDAYPEAETKWYHNDTALSYSDNIEVDTDDNALVIKNMTLADVGNYKCEVTNEGNRKVMTAFVSISGLGSPEVRVSNEEIILKPGDWKEVECIVDRGNPAPVILWEFKKEEYDDFKQMPSEVFVDNGKFKIPSAKMENGGYYMCTASNMMGQATATVNIKIQYPPKISNDENTETTLAVKEGDMVELACKVDAIPDARVRWEMSQDDVITPFEARHTTDDANTHRFYALWKDSGNYHCIAENELGRAEKTIFVNVLVAPYIQPPQAKEMTLRAGSTLELDCIVLYANPMPTTMWEFIAVDSTATIMSRGTSNNPLRIRNVSKANEGMYLCIAENSVGNDRIRINLKVL